MTVMVNGERRELPDEATVADVVADLGRDPDRPGAAVVLNGEVLPRGRWPVTVLADSDAVEVVVAVQGG